MAHGTSLRGLVKEIENLSDEEVTQLNLPNAIPFVYELDPSTLKPLEAKRFLADEETVKKAVAKVASIGTKKWFNEDILRNPPPKDQQFFVCRRNSQSKQGPNLFFRISYNFLKRSSTTLKYIQNVRKKLELRCKLLV